MINSFKNSIQIKGCQNWQPFSFDKLYRLYFQPHKKLVGIIIQSVNRILDRGLIGIA